ncbi:MAG TPA: hypothetical protein DEG17_27100 [Cyanobacteria bacterium UBA11149]|nr:hypothetical protein [Cyanobacteria bacterium UBA11366]HBK63734.1 hypothetical protein [Cyanobacteria bacterium UBA11166]HBR72580.1 hypothetical protein [Cyanobacteria bacterium UBA11159]HBS71426.1 hypothetical protein [Cyanobacteria bacterium UBA11153]HBW92434.1 hypothetical protein [Cyanobacteria bacterium UBA11149]HCA97491.1 hypothetical protein [Cyanobacteria bacterium UBA9226]
MLIFDEGLELFYFSTSVWNVEVGKDFERIVWHMKIVVQSYLSLATTIAGANKFVYKSLSGGISQCLFVFM